MALVELVIVPRYVALPLFLVLLYLGSCTLSCVNTGIFYQNNKSVLPEVLVAAHLAFCVVGFVGFFCVSALFWMWSAKYSHTRSERTWRLFLGIWVVALCKDLPLFVIESMTIAHTGWWTASTLQTVCYIIQIVFFVISITLTGMSYAWYVSGLLERGCGSSLVRPLRARQTKFVEYPVGGAFGVPSPSTVAPDVFTPPVMLQDPSRTTPRHPRPTVSFAGVTEMTDDGEAPSAPARTPRRSSAYELNYATMNYINPATANALYGSARAHDAGHSTDIPPPLI